MMQVPDTSVEALPVAIFRRKIDRRGPFDDCIRRYSQEYLLLMMQSAGCLGCTRPPTVSSVALDDARWRPTRQRSPQS